MNQNLEAKRLCKLYEEFYQKEPNFLEENRKNITIEMQAMAYLLEQYGVSCGLYRFSYNSDIKMPISIELQDVIVMHLLGHSAKEYESDLELNKRTKKIISLVGSKIREKLEEKINPIEMLQRIASVYYARTLMLLGADSKTIASSMQIPIDEITEVDKLIRKISLEHLKDI